MSEVRETRRWRGVIAVALVAGAVGLLANRPALLLLAVVGVVYATYPRVTRTPTIDLDLERRLDVTAPAHGEPVAVTVTLTNVGSRNLVDCRVVDGVPAALRVIDGSPRRGVALAPGASASFTYSVEAKRGRHAFEPATIVARDASGAREVETTVAAATQIDCTADLAALPLRDRTRAVAGRIAASRGTSGIAFHRTREYRRGDPTNRIDWNRYARTGDLTTVEYEESQAATVVVVVDARERAYRGRPDDPHAVAYGVSAAEQLVRALGERRNWVGVAGIGREACWLDPGSGAAHADEAARFLATHPTFSSTPPPDDRNLERQFAAVREWVSDTAQVVLLSPCGDDEIVDAALRFDAAGYPTTVLTPDVTGSGTAGQRLAAIERANRLSELRRADVPVYEWDPAEPLSASVDAVDGGVAP